MTTVNVYLAFDGNCREAFQFYQSVFGCEFSYLGTYGEMPKQEGMPPLPESEKDKIMHIALPISKETMLMGYDTTELFGNVVTHGDNISIMIDTSTTDEADRLFKKLSEGGKVTMPMEKTFWGAYYGTFTDKFGINWMVHVDLNK